MKTRKTGKSIRPFSPTLWLLAVALAMALSLGGGFAQAQEEFKYGAAMPVTGPIPQYGEYCVRGSQLALEDLEKRGWVSGKKIRVILEDGKNDPKVSLAAMNKLINIDKVPIVESVGSSVVLALGPVAQENKVILMNCAAQNPLIRKLGSYVFSLVPLADRVMARTVEIAAKRMKAKTIAMLHVNNEYGRGVANTFKDLFEKEYGGKILTTEIFAQGETDFTTIVTKLKFANADLIFYVGHENELGYSIKKSRQMGVKTPWLCPPGAFNALTLSIAGDSAEGLMGADYFFDPEFGADKMKAFGKRYKERFGILPANPVARTYDSIMIYEAALKSGARTSTQIRDYYLSLKNYDGVSGPVTFDKDGITLEQPVVRQVREGKIVVAE